ncbi:MAG: DciA family protein [Burkholderiales bacterium]
MARRHIQRPGFGQAVRDYDNLHSALPLPKFPLLPSKADRFLIADAGMERVVAKARELRSLTKSCTDFLPPTLARQIRAVNLRDGELSLLAANPAAAAKLKLIAESLRKFLLQQGSKVNSVSVRVQPTRSHWDESAAPKAIALSDGGKVELSALYERLSPSSPMRRALGTLLERQGVRIRSPNAPQKSAAGRKRTGKPRT